MAYFRPRITRTEISSTEKGKPGTVHHNWNTRKVLERIDAAVLEGLEHVKDRAKEFWQEEWTPDRHPDMTGEMRDKGVFEVRAEAGHVTELRIGSTAAHALFEEYGTVHRAGHAPIRKTIDFAAPRLRPAIRAALRKGNRSAQ